MADTRANPHVQQYEELKIPSEWTGEQRRYAQRSIAILDDLYRRFGRLGLSDLGKGLRQWIDGVDGGMLEIIESAKGLTVRVTSAEGSIAQIVLTAEQLATRVENAEGDISQIQQTAQEIAARVTDAEGNISQVRQTAQEISARVEGVAGDVSQVSQTAQEIAARVTGVEGDVTEIQLTTDGIAAAVKNNRLRFTEKGLEIINASGQVVFSQSNTTGDLTISGILNALGGVIGGFTIGDSSLSAGGTRIVLDALNGRVQLGGLTISDSTSYGPVLQATGGLSFVVGGQLYWILADGGVTAQRPVYARYGLFATPGDPVSHAPNMWMDPATGKIHRTTATGGGGTTDPDPDPDPPTPTPLTMEVGTSPSPMLVGGLFTIYANTHGGTPPYYRYLFEESFNGGPWQTVQDGSADVASWTVAAAGICQYRVTVWDSAGGQRIVYSSTITFY